MTTLFDLLDRARPPAPWAEGDNIPWDDPGFSERMLAEHLSQAHDLASRRIPAIDSHLDTIRSLVPEGGRILDLGCGPGLYCHALARHGFRCHGIDFSPASIGHALTVADAESLDCTFELSDVRTAELGDGFDLVMMIFGQINVFPRPVARDLLTRAVAALRPGGVLLLEPQRGSAVRSTVSNDATWTTSAGGLFSPRPHLLLEESFWDEHERTATHRWHVIDLGEATVDRFAMSTCGYDDGEIEAVLGEIGVAGVETRPHLAAEDHLATEGLFVVTGTRSG